GNVTPLVGSANLQRNAVQFIQAGKIIPLQQVVGELGKRDALIVTVQTLFNRFFVDHLIHGEVLGDITEEGQHVHAAKPVVVVSSNGRVVAAVKVAERCDLLANFVYPLLHGIFRIQFTLGGFKAWVTDQTGRATHQSN